MNGVNRFLGDSPIRVLIKLILISFLVGIVMSAFGWSPVDIVYGIRSFFLELWNMGFARRSTASSAISCSARRSSCRPSSCCGPVSYRR